MLHKRTKAQTFKYHTLPSIEIPDNDQLLKEAIDIISDEFPHNDLNIVFEKMLRKASLFHYRNDASGELCAFSLYENVSVDVGAGIGADHVHTLHGVYQSAFFVRRDKQNQGFSKLMLHSFMATNNPAFICLSSRKIYWVHSVQQTLSTYGYICFPVAYKPPPQIAFTMCEKILKITGRSYEYLDQSLVRRNVYSDRSFAIATLGDIVLSMNDAIMCIAIKNNLINV